MTSPQLRYFKQVLGIHSVVVPESLSQQMHKESFGNEASPNLALINEPLTPEYEGLIQKMFSSVGISDFCIVDHEKLGGSKLKTYIDGKKLIWIYGEPVKVDSEARVFSLPSLSDLVHDQNAKREAWSKIKVLK